MEKLWEKEKILRRSGDSVTSGVNVGDYPRHHFVGNPMLTVEEGQSSGLLEVSSAGTDEWLKGCMRRRVNSNISSFELVTEGEMLFKSSRGSFNVEAGQLFIVHFNEDSSMTPLSARLCKKTVICPGRVTASIMATAGLDKVDLIDTSSMNDIERIFDLLESELSGQKDDFNIRVSELVFGLIIRLSKKVKMPEYPQILEKLVEYIYKNVRNNLSLRDMALFAGISQGTVNNLFHRHFRTSPVEFALRHKIKVAETLLLDPNRYIKEIADALGYSNQFYFSLDFKKRTGLSPSEFRKKNLP